MARGLSQQEDKTKTYVKCSHGVFVQRMNEPTRDTITRSLKAGPNTGDEVHELHFQKIEGQIVSISKRTHDQYGDSWEFTIDVSETPEDPKSVVLSLSFDSGYAKNIFYRLPNINLDKDVVFNAYTFTPADSDKERKGISLSQEGRKVSPAYTKDAPNGLPPMKVVKVKGKDVWDDSEQMLFLEQMLEKDIFPKLAIQPETAEENTTSETQEGEGEDLPF